MTGLMIVIELVIGLKAVLYCLSYYCYLKYDYLPAAELLTSGELSSDSEVVRGVSGSMISELSNSGITPPPPLCIYLRRKERGDRLIDG